MSLNNGIYRPSMLGINIPFCAALVHVLGRSLAAECVGSTMSCKAYE